MIAHVAEAGEQRGRVVLRLVGGPPSDIALQSAVRIARAFQSEIESLFVQDRQLFDACAYGFAREICATGRERRVLTADSLAAEMARVAAFANRRLEVLARAADVPTRTRTVCDDPVRAVAAACAECGPWNVIVIAEPITPDAGDQLARLLTDVPDATAVLVVGPRVAATKGPILILVEDEAHIAPMLSTAERLRANDDEKILLMLAVDAPDELAWAEMSARRIVSDRDDVIVRVAPAMRGVSAAVTEHVRRERPSFVVAQFGGLLVPEGPDLRHLVIALEAPLLVVH